MYEYTSLVNNSDIINIIQRTFNYVDSRLIGHGTRVAYIVSKMLNASGEYSAKQQRDICILAMFHDIGAYKTEDINNMVMFETESGWNHAIYGYLFLKYFSPYSELAPAVLFHHTNWLSLQNIEQLDNSKKKLAQIFSIADRADIYFMSAKNNITSFVKYLTQVSGTKFSPEVVTLFIDAKIKFPLQSMTSLEFDFEKTMNTVSFNTTEIDAFLKLIIFSIDFRSEHTVTHTITTTSISRSLARRLHLQDSIVNEIVCGAMLHDLGKIGIPVEILEFPGKLSPQAMSIMRNHVNLTENILNNCITPSIRRIALRHHEKLDGSGYPKGLKGSVLTPSERIVAIADIVSALYGTRSYKDAFPKEKTIEIVNTMAKQGLIDKDIVNLLISDFDAIMKEVSEQSTPLISTYQGVQNEYNTLVKQLSKF